MGRRQLPRTLAVTHSQPSACQAPALLWVLLVNSDPMISLLLLAAGGAPGTELPARSQKFPEPRGENLPSLSHFIHVARYGLEILARVLFFSPTSFPDELGKPPALRKSLRAQ